MIRGEDLSNWSTVSEEVVESERGTDSVNSFIISNKGIGFWLALRTDLGTNPGLKTCYLYHLGQSLTDSLNFSGFFFCDKRIK